jgi:hypothetical protein
MGETVGSYVRKRAQTMAAIVIAGWAFLIWGVARHGPADAGESTPWYLWLGAFWVLASTLGKHYVVKCPTCSRPIGRFVGFPRLALGREIEDCPYCGVSFDKPML